MLYAEANVPLEITLAGSGKNRVFENVDVDVVVKGPSGYVAKIPAFWQGGSRFGARIAAPATGKYSYTTTCSDAADQGLHGKTGEIEVAPYSGANPLCRHGRLRVSADKRYLEHADGTPFFWLADTWWMGLCKRLSWPLDFKALTRDRVAKGFRRIMPIYQDWLLVLEAGS